MDKAALRWQCRRGLLELDLMLNAFLDQAYDTLSLTEKQHFAELLATPDQTLYGWLIATEVPPAAYLQTLVNHIRETLCMPSSSN